MNEYERGLQDGSGRVGAAVEAVLDSLRREAEQCAARRSYVAATNLRYAANQVARAIRESGGAA